MKAVQMLLACLGRMFIGVLFFLAGLHQVLDWHGSLQLFSNGLAHFRDQVHMIPWALGLVENIVSWGSTLMMLSTAFLLMGGLLVFFGLKTRLGSLLLLLVIIPTIVIFHLFWLFPPEEREIQVYYFMNHLAILGGLLTLLAFGNGSHGKKTVIKNKQGDPP